MVGGPSGVFTSSLDGCARGKKQMTIENCLDGKNGTTYVEGYLKENEGLKIHRKLFAWKWTRFLKIKQIKN